MYYNRAACQKRRRFLLSTGLCYLRTTKTGRYFLFKKGYEKKGKELLILLSQLEHSIERVDCLSRKKRKSNPVWGYLLIYISFPCAFILSYLFRLEKLSTSFYYHVRAPFPCLPFSSLFCLL